MYIFHSCQSLSLDRKSGSRRKPPNISSELKWLPFGKWMNFWTSSSPLCTLSRCRASFVTFLWQYVQKYRLLLFSSPNCIFLHFSPSFCFWQVTFVEIGVISETKPCYLYLSSNEKRINLQTLGYPVWMFLCNPFSVIFESKTMEFNNSVKQYQFNTILKK